MIMANVKSGVGNNIKLIRKSRGITQEELAGVIGMHPRQLSKIENGDHFPSSKSLEKICIALDAAPKDLFDFEFLVASNEGAMTGTDNSTLFQVSKVPENNNIYELFPNKEEDKETIICTDSTMAKTAKALNQPVFVEYFEDKKTSKIVVFYPDGKEKVIMNSEDVEEKRNLNYMLSEFKKIAKDKQSVEYIKLALSSLSDDDALKKISNLIEGIKLVRGVE